MDVTEQVKNETAWTAARLLQNAADDKRIAADTRERMKTSAHTIYRVFGEPPSGATSTGGNYFP